MSRSASPFPVITLLTVLGLSAGGVAGQAVEFGLFGQTTKFDNAMGFDNAFGGGGHLGVFILNLLGVEADVGYGNSDHAPSAGSSSQLSARARLLIAPQSGPIGLLVGGGGVYNKYGYSSRAWETGVSGLLGFQVRLGDALRIRAVGVGDFMPSTALPAGQSTNLHLGAQIGLSFRPGSGGGRTARAAEEASPQSPADADRDGVRDSLDRCADTPRGTMVDATGCAVPPPDTDRDGVPDPRDRCANTAPGVAVGPDGCARQPADADGDGVPDAADRCADTPTGTSVGADGCPLPPADGDGDGVPDSADRCPATAAGTPVGADGCALPPADSDRDGVADPSDRCPNTAAGSTVDANGCPVPPPDRDNDGVPDNADRCPATPAGVTVGADGCRRAPADTDGDGVPDPTDRCAGTPVGTVVGADGCPAAPAQPQPAAPPADGDGDGVPDSRDRCLNTPAGASVDATGCTPPPPPTPEPEPTAGGTPVVVTGMRFVRNSDGITFPVEPILNRLADSLAALPSGRWEIAVHTDEGGSPAGSLDLSQRRADQIRNYLIGRGVAPQRLVARGYGRAAMAGASRRVELRPLN